MLLYVCCVAGAVALGKIACYGWFQAGPTEPFQAGPMELISDLKMFMGPQGLANGVSA